MRQGQPSEPLPLETQQLDQPQKDREGYVYHCSLCDEPLVLSKQQVDPRKILLIFDGVCPGCGFELENVLNCDSAQVPPGASFYTNPRCNNPYLFFEERDPFKSETRRGSALPHDSQPSISTGTERLDRTLVLKFGQLVSLQGETSHRFSHLLCVRATLPQPLGAGSDTIFLDGGNLFDTYTISQYAAGLGLDPAKVEERIHLSRAFTHHQLSSLVTEKLPLAIDQHDARLAIVSDITQLYCDPDVRDKREALDLFTKNLQFLGSLAEKKNMLIVITNLESRSRRMDDALFRSAHVSARLEDRGGFTHLTITRHPLIPQEGSETVTFENQDLGKYL